jgi:hypothetical protein
MNSDRFLAVWDGEEPSHIAVQPSKINRKNATCDINLNSNDAIEQNPTKLFSQILKDLEYCQRMNRIDLRLLNHS